MYRLLGLLALLAIGLVGIAAAAPGKAAPRPRRPAAPAITVTPTPRPCGGFAVVPSAEVPDASSYLNAIVAVPGGPPVLWAAGTSHGDVDHANHTLVERWDGTSWSIVPSPDPAQLGNVLFGLAALSPADVWAVGQYIADLTTENRPLVEHWDGTAWSLVSAAYPGVGDTQLVGVAAAGPADVWAVGNHAGDTLIEHWDGTAWTIVPSPNVDGSNGLRAVAVAGPADVWAVGDGNGQALIEHWDGSAWTIFPSPAVAGALKALVVSGPTEIWAVGGGATGGGPVPLAEHWDGTAWTLVPPPQPGNAVNDLHGVVIAGGVLWGAGVYADSGSPSRSWVTQWTGAGWRQEPTLDPGQYGDGFFAAARAADDAIWTVGHQIGANGTQPLVERLRLSCPPTATPSRVPTRSPSPSATATAPAPTATATRVTPTATAAPPTPTVTATRLAPTATPTLLSTATPWQSPTAQPTGAPTSTPGMAPTVPPSPTPPPASTTPLPATATAAPSATAPPGLTGTATPAACTLSFRDVQATDYFYQPVLYLACRGVVSGYADGTFRPYNDTTRGQMVKIVVLGFGKPLLTPPASGYTFADVPPAAPFFAGVETAAGTGIVSGYTCGGPGEPCDAQSRPYFRPNAAVTRGQLSKIDAVAAGWPLINPPAPTFADVPPASPFYQDVETAVCHGVISGYADHTFHPFANATRGQIAKIVYLSITAGGSCLLR